MAIQNKRSSRRYDSLNLLSYAVYESDGTVSKQGMGRTLNVSHTGILLETHQPVQKDQRVDLTLGLGDDIVEIRGQAVYSRQGKDNRFETGIHFETIDANQKAVLETFIRAFESQSS